MCTKMPSVCLGRRQKQKYEIVDSQPDYEEGEGPEPHAPHKKFCTPTCVSSSLATAILIGIYFAPSMGLTFYQRWLYNKVKFPLTTVLIHMLIKYKLAAIIRLLVAIKFGRYRPTGVGWKEYLLALAPTGVFAGIDIGFSNWGLELINVSLYTMTKSTSIIFILAFAILFKLEKKSWSLCTIVIMISTGLVLFTYKATNFDPTGFTLVLVASMSSGVRWTCVQMLLQKSQMGMKNPIEMIYHMQPFMILSLLPFLLWIELPSVIDYLYKTPSKEVQTIFMYILVGAFIAFFMEISEVMVVTYTSSLTLSVAGIFKELLMVIIAVEFTGDKISKLNVIGLLICMCGIISHVIHKIRTVQQVNLQFSRTFEFDAHDSSGSMSKLMEDQISISSESEGERDSQVLFNILNRHDR